MQYLKYPVRKPIVKDLEKPINSPLGEIHKAIYLWRGIAWYINTTRQGLCLDKKTAKYYLSKNCLKYGILMGNEYYFEDGVNAFIVFHEMPVLLRKLAEATQGKAITEEEITKIAREQVPQYFN